MRECAERVIEISKVDVNKSVSNSVILADVDLRMNVDVLYLEILERYVKHLLLLMKRDFNRNLAYGLV